MEVRRPGRHGALTGLAVAGLLVVLVAAFAAGRQVERDGGSAATSPAGPAVATGDIAAAGGVLGSGAVGSGTMGSGVVAVGAAPGPDATGSSGPADADAVPVGSVTRPLVRTAQLDLDADDPNATGREIRTAAVTAGGTVAEEDSSDSGSRLTLRVPVDRLDSTMDAVAAWGHVTSRQSQRVDATEDVVDLDARVAGQRAGVDRVRALLAHATSIGDVVSIESELTRREADLDSLTGRLDALRGQVALSTLTVDVERGPPPPAPGGPDGFLSGLADGWDGLRAIATGTGAAVGYVLPFLPLLAVLAGVVWVGRRIARSRRTAPAAERPGPDRVTTI